MNTSPQLLASIEKLYEAFSGYPLPEKMDCCPCGCNRAEHTAALYARPLRELDRDNLDFYSFCALTTMGNEADFKHFLPRLLELKVATPQPSQLLTDLDVILGKLRYGNWGDWPQAEQSCIIEFLHALWTSVLSDLSWRTDEFEYIDDFLSAIAQAEDDLTPYLDEWTKAENLEACLALVSLINDSEILAEEHGTAYWEKRQAQYAQLRQWVFSSNAISRLDYACDRWPSSSYLDEFIKARRALLTNTI